jgi:uncharacterized membrane protein YadS
MKSWLRSEDTLAVVIGLLIVTMSLGNLVGVDLLGWAISTKIWIDPLEALFPVSKNFSHLSGFASLLLTYTFLLCVLLPGIQYLGVDMAKFAVRFTVLFFLTYFCWFLGSYTYIASTPDKLKGIDWALGLTAEAGYLIALLGGLFISNFIPKFAVWLKEAARSELYIKTAIVILGAGLGVKAAAASGLANAILFRGFAAIIEAYLIYWAFVYFIARRYFGFSREWAAPLASGISICGVSAAITTGAAIRARPIVPIMVSSLVVIFSVIEMLLLPQLAKVFLHDQPMVAAGWMGLAVKTDGAATSSGAIAEAFILEKNAQEGINYEPGWMVMTTTTVKVFIDLFIGVWAIVLAAIWTWKIEKKPDQKLPLRDIWERMPKFVFGYAFTFLAFLAIGLAYPSSINSLKAATEGGDVFRKLFFVLTFFSIGLLTNFRRLWAEGIAKLALVYFISLFGFVIWIGLVISWLFFQGVTPPLKS